MKFLSSIVLTSLIFLHSNALADITVNVIEDTETQQDNATANNSTLDTVSFGAPGSGQARSMLLRFGGPELTAAAALANSEIVEVRLELDMTSNDGEREGTFAMLNAGNADWTNTGASWDNRDGTNAWVGAGGARSVAGDTFGSMGLIVIANGQEPGTVSLLLDPVAGGFADYEAMFDELVDGINNGFVIYNDGGAPNSGTQTFTSLEGSTAVGGFAPRLVVVTSSSALLGDVNLDGAVDFLDISPFIAVLSGGPFQAEADCDESGAVDFLDISPFITILSGSGS